MLCFRYTSNKRLDMFLFSSPSKQRLRMDLHIEFRVSFDSMYVRAYECEWRYFASGCFYFIIRCSLHSFSPGSYIFFSSIQQKNGSFVPNEFFSTFFLLLNAKTIVLVSMVARMSVYGLMNEIFLNGSMEIVRGNHLKIKFYMRWNRR